MASTLGNGHGADPFSSLLRFYRTVPYCHSWTACPFRFLQQLIISAHTLQRVYFSLGHLMASPPFHMGLSNKSWEEKQALPDPSRQSVPGTQLVNNISAVWGCSSALDPAFIVHSENTTGFTMDVWDWWGTSSRARVENSNIFKCGRLAFFWLYLVLKPLLKLNNGFSVSTFCRSKESHMASLAKREF